MSGETLDLDAIEARAKAATPGPWRWGPGSWDERDGEPNGWDDKLYSPTDTVHSDGSARGEYGPDIDVRGPDAAFIAAARTDIPALVAEVRRLREAVQDADDARHDALLIAETWEVDAGRYRFLRDNPLGFRAVDGNASVPPHPDVLDRWVDAAIAEAAHD